MIRFWVIRSPMRGVKSFQGQNPHCRCWCMRGRQVRPFCWILQSYSTSDCVGFGDLHTAGRWDLDRCPSNGLGGGQVIRDGTAGLSVPILRVRRTAVYRWQPGIWIAASSCSVSGACGSSGVGSTLRLFTNFLGGSVGQGTSDGSGYQPTAGRRCYVVKSADTVTVCYAMNRMSFSMMALGLGQSLFPRVEVDDMSPAPRAARAASYMSAMGLWRPQTGPGCSRAGTSFVLPLVYELQILLSGGSAFSGVIVLIQILHLHDQPVGRYILCHELKFAV